MAQFGLHLNQMQKLFVLCTCMLTILALATIFWDHSGCTDQQVGRGTQQIKGHLETELSKLPEEDLLDESFIQKLKYFLECDKDSKTISAFQPKKVGQHPEVPVYVITPTYPRALQIPELTRMGQTLKHIKNLIWIVAEDATTPTAQVLELLEDLGVYYQYLRTPMPPKFRIKAASSWPKGVENRNRGLEWILKHAKETGDDSGVFYFADDDNTYDIRLFEEIRKTKRVSLFPVGFISHLPTSTPVLHTNGTFLEFYEGWVGGRKYPVDMAAFAVNLKHFMEKDSKKPIRMAFQRGYEEESFLKRLQVEPKDIEFLAENCTKIYVWHTKTEKPSLKNYKPLDTAKLENTNLGYLMNYWCLYVNDQPCDFLPKSMDSKSDIPQTSKDNSNNDNKNTSQSQAVSKTSIQAKNETANGAK